MSVTSDSENKLQFLGVFKHQKFGDEAVQVKIILGRETKLVRKVTTCYILVLPYTLWYSGILYEHIFSKFVTPYTAEVIQPWNIIGILMKNITCK